MESLSFESWESTLLSIFHSLFYRFEVWTGHDLASFVDWVGCWLSELVRSFVRSSESVHLNHEMISFLGILSSMEMQEVLFDSIKKRASFVLLWFSFSIFSRTPLCDISRFRSAWCLRRVQVNCESNNQLSSNETKCSLHQPALEFKWCHDFPSLFNLTFNIHLHFSFCII